MFIAVQIAQGEAKMLSSHGYEPREKSSVNTETQLTLKTERFSLQPVIKVQLQLKLLIIWW